MKIKRKRKSFCLFDAYMSMATRFNFSENNRLRLVVILNEEIQDFDFLSICDQQDRILALFELPSETFDLLLLDELEKSRQKEKVMMN